VPLNKFLLPIGFTTGFALQTGTEELHGVLEIRLGGRFVCVNAVEHDVWWQARWHQTLPRLISWAIAAEVADAEEVTDRLMRGGLLFNLDSDSCDLFMHDYRALPMGFGTGCDEPGSDLFTVRGADLDPLLRLDGLTYTFWSLCDGYRTIGMACAELARAASVGYEDIVDRVLSALVVMVQAGAVTVDISKGAL
jgi:hypothetical protein